MSPNTSLIFCLDTTNKHSKLAPGFLYLPSQLPPSSSHQLWGGSRIPGSTSRALRVTPVAAGYRKKTHRSLLYHRAPEKPVVPAHLAYFDGLRNSGALSQGPAPLPPLKKSLGGKVRELLLLGYHGILSGGETIAGDLSPLFPCPMPVLVYPGGRRQRRSALIGKAQAPGWICLYEVKRTSFQAVRTEKRHRLPSVSSP